MNKCIIKHFGSMTSFILSIIAVLACITGLFVSFKVNNLVGNIILFVSLLIMFITLKD